MCCDGLKTYGFSACKNIASQEDPQTAIPWLLIFVTSSAKTLRSRFASEARLETCQHKGRSVIMDFVITYMENSAVNQSSMIMVYAITCMEIKDHIHFIIALAMYTIRNKVHILILKKLTCDLNWDASLFGSSPRISFNPDATENMGLLSQPHKCWNVQRTNWEKEIEYLQLVFQSYMQSESHLESACLLVWNKIKYLPTWKIGLKNQKLVLHCISFKITNLSFVLPRISWSSATDAHCWKHQQWIMKYISQMFN